MVRVDDIRARESKSFGQEHSVVKVDTISRTLCIMHHDMDGSQAKRRSAKMDKSSQKTYGVSILVPLQPAVETGGMLAISDASENKNKKTGE